MKLCANLTCFVRLSVFWTTNVEFVYNHTSFCGLTDESLSHSHEKNL